MRRQPEETRAALVAAALETLKTEGFRGTTARAIAGRAGVNQALVFYHFGGVDELLLAALVALYLGLNLLSRLDPASAQAESLFALMERVAPLLPEPTTS